MDESSVSLIVPAFNEERTVADVLGTAHESGVFSEIICVDDGSTDDTSLAAKSVSGVRVIRQNNMGKALALKAGLSDVTTPVVCFLDADLLNLTVEHILALITPVISGNAEATIGVFKGGRGATDFAQKIAPMISGQRCLETRLLKDFDAWERVGFGIEHALNDHLRKQGVKMLKVPLRGASHLMKEEKHGVFRGFLRRLAMYLDIIKYNLGKH